jgi:type II secretion system protein C
LSLLDMNGPALARHADARGTLTGASQAVNHFSQHDGTRNLNSGNDLPTLARVRDAIVLQRSANVAQALLVVVAAYCGALAVNAGVAFWLDSVEPVPLEATLHAPLAEIGSERSVRNDYSIVFERNLFGSEPIGTTDAAAPGVASASLSLRGTAELDGRGFAVFEDTADGRQDVFLVGERVFDGPKLVAVEPGRATVLTKGRKQVYEISVGDEEESEEPGPTPEKTADLGQGIRKTGENAYAVDRREVEYAVENLNTIITQMRAVPYLRDGASLGFRVFNIRPESLFERMGLKNGDVIQSVNGIELSSPSQALGLLNSVASADELQVNLLRNNQPNTLTYAIQ